MPNPGPGGGLVKDVGPPAGSAAHLSLTCGPGGGRGWPFFKANKISFIVAGVKSS